MVEALNNSLAGLQKSSLNVAKAADNIVNPQRNTEITKDIVDVKQGEQNFKANATVLAATKEMQEDLYRAVDIKV
jgi:flagellar basal body rod protein FlgC